MTILKYCSALALMFTSSFSFASGDGDGCSFWLTDCPLPTYPLFLSDNDTKGNLLMLLADQQGLTLPFTVPEDPVNQRDMELFSLQRLPLPGELEDQQTREQLTTRLDTYDPSFPALLEHYAGRDSLYGRAISNSLQSVSLFLDALEQSDVSSNERSFLLKSRLQILAQLENELAPTTEMSASAKEWQTYLEATRHFYDGKFSDALAGFDSLQHAQTPWVAEAASYMMVRAYLNAAMRDTQDEYGSVDISKSNNESLKKAMAHGKLYLAAYPQGRYTSSTKGLFRRIIWMSGDLSALRDTYNEVMATSQTLPELEALVNEIDMSLLSADAYRNQNSYEDLTQPDLLFINALRGLRTSYKQTRYWSDEQLSVAIKQLHEMGKKEESSYLQAYLFFENKQFEEVLALLPETEEQNTSTLAFSRQMLRIWALQGMKAFDKTEHVLRTLVATPLTKAQQAFVENMLADQWLRTGNIAAIFNKDSPVTQLRIRTVVLKQSTDTALLRQQSRQAPSPSEQQIALHTLLVKDLMAGEYATFLTDIALIPHDYKEINPPVDAPWQPTPNGDVRLSTFKWGGEGTPQGYYCQDLTTTLGALIQRSDDGHALNCLGEYLRNKEPEINLWQGQEMIWGLSASKSITTPSRLKLYQAVIANPKAEPEDKSYALYRAINCYAPSGYNGCDNQEISKGMRQTWFNTLKQRYGNSVWAKSLKYYW